MLFKLGDVWAPTRLMCDIGGDPVFAVVHGSPTGKAIGVDVDEIEAQLELISKAGGLFNAQRPVVRIEHHDCGLEAIANSFDKPANRSQSTIVRCARRDHFKDLVLRIRELLVTLAL